MSERSGKRPLNYSKWHRPESIERFVGADDAKMMAMTDIDGVETNTRYPWPLFLVETAEYSGNYDIKDAKKGWQKSVITNLAKYSALSIEAYLVLYELDKSAYVPQSDNDKSENVYDIKRMHVCRLHPESNEEFTMTPSEYASFIRDTRLRIDPIIREEVQRICNVSINQ